MTTDKTSGDNTEPSHDTDPSLSIEYPHPAQNPGSTQQPAEQKENKTFWLWRRKTLTSLQLLFNLFLALIYASQVYFMREQWNTMNAQLEEMRSNSADTKAAVEVAKRSAEVAERSLEYAERAWVVYTGTGPISHPGEEKMFLEVIDGILKVEMSFINAGKSPAFNITTYTGHVIIDKDSPPPCDPTSVPGPPVSRGVLAGNGQGSPIKPRRAIAMTNEEFIAIETIQEKRMYLYGAITYDDEFRHPRKTQFCLVHLPNVEGGGFSYCPCGNILDSVDRNS